MGPTSAPTAEIKITAIDQFSKVFNAAIGNLRGFAGQVDTIAQGLGNAGKIMAGLGVGALWFGERQLSGLLGYNEEVLRMAKITGFSVEETQKLRFAILQSEGDVEALARVFLKLNSAKMEALKPTPNKNVFGISGGLTQAKVKVGGSSHNIGEMTPDTNKMRKAFSDLGISLLDSNGKIRSTIEIILDLADSLERGKSTEEDLASAMDLLGIRQGKNFIPFLRAGRKHLEELMATAEKMGIISNEQSKEIDNLNDRIKALTLPIMKLKADLAESLFPILIRTGDVIEAVAKKIGQLPKATREALTQFALFDSLKLIGLGTLLMLLPKITGAMVGLLTPIGLLQAGLMALLALPLSLFLGDQIIKLFDTAKGYQDVTGSVTDVRKTTEDMINSVGQGLLKVGAGVIDLGNVWLGLKANLLDIKATWLGLMSLWMDAEAINPFNLYGKKSRENLRSWSDYYQKQAGADINAGRNLDKLMGERSRKAEEMRNTKFHFSLPETIGLYKPGGNKVQAQGQSDGEDYADGFNKGLGATLGKSSFGAEAYLPSLMSVQGNFSGSVDLTTGKMKFFDMLTGAAKESTAAIIDLKDAIGGVADLANMTPANKMPDVSVGTSNLPDLIGATNKGGSMVGGYYHQPVTNDIADVGRRARLDYQSYLDASDIAEKNYRQGGNVLHFTIYADDRRVGEAVQTTLNKSIH